jgi:hypothetical protein
MTNTGFSGIDYRQSGTALVLREALQLADGSAAVSGTATVRLFEVQSDGTYKTFDFTNHTFTAGAVSGSDTATMTHQQGSNGSFDMGTWTYPIASLGGFTRGATYLQFSRHDSSDAPTIAREWVYGGPGDLTVTSAGKVTAGTVDDKTGYALAQAFPSHFAALGINASGHIARVVLTDTTTDLTNGGGGSGDDELHAEGVVASSTATTITAVSGAPADVSGDSWIVCRKTDGSGLGFSVRVLSVAGQEFTVDPSATGGEIPAGDLPDGDYSWRLYRSFTRPVVKVAESSVEPDPAPIATAAAAAVLADPSHKLTTDASGRVTLAPTQAFNNTGTFTGNLAGNVTGSVGSVVGDVGGRVVGSVASVTSPVTVGTNNDKSGYILAAAGLDAVPVEAGVNARQALSPILAASAGALLGAGTGTIVIKGGNVSVTRITATTDNSGNRTAVTLALPA